MPLRPGRVHESLSCLVGVWLACWDGAGAAAGVAASDFVVTSGSLADRMAAAINATVPGGRCLSV